MKVISLILLIAVSASAQNKVNNKDLKILCTYMCGVFNSEQQSKNDSAFYNITLHMKPIWLKSKDGYYLYVEQAVTTLMDKPYRQRVYHVYIFNDSTIISQVYELKNPKAHIGSWKEKKPLKNFNPDSLDVRNGCAIYLHKNVDGTFSGSTPGKECLSNLRGAAYATSEVVIHPNKIISWDRGWDINDKQVWGAVKGGYEFIKTEKYSLK